MKLGRQQPRFDELLLPLYAAQDAGALVEATVGLMRATIDGDSYGVAICDPVLRHTICTWSPEALEIARYMPAFERVVDQHPMVKAWRRAENSGRAMRISDCIGDAEFRNGAMYSEVFRPMRTRAQLGVWAQIGVGEHVSISANRTGSDFSTTDVAALARIRSHVAQAYRNVRLFAELRALPGPAEQLYVGGRQVMVVDATLYVPDLLRNRRNGLNGHGALASLEPITPREREVLHWVREGKTNPEIGQILDISPRTTQKHLENVFRKLNVETRTAAAMRAVELGVPR